jgi:prepilin-type N-terminal cleavage/methylation domain-containing protein
MKYNILGKKGFTLIELLVVIAIIGLLSTLAVVSLNNAREKSRDAKRVSDIRQIQTGLELYYADQNGYPVAAAAITLGAAGAKVLSANHDFSVTPAPADPGTIYIGNVPANPTPGGAHYLYTSAAGTTYSITFTLEGQTGQLQPGARTASPSGIQ